MIEGNSSRILARLKFTLRLIYGGVAAINCVISNVNPTCCSGYSVSCDRGNS